MIDEPEATITLPQRVWQQVEYLLSAHVDEQPEFREAWLALRGEDSGPKSPEVLDVMTFEELEEEMTGSWRGGGYTPTYSDDLCIRVAIAATRKFVPNATRINLDWSDQGSGLTLINLEDSEGRDIPIPQDPLVDYENTMWRALSSIRGLQPPVQYQLANGVHRDMHLQLQVYCRNCGQLLHRAELDMRPGLTWVNDDDSPNCPQDDTPMAVNHHPEGIQIPV
jgi:hypothetical protein